METLLASTFTGILMFVMGFWLARMIYLPQIHSAKNLSRIYHSQLQRMKLKSARTDAENAAGMVS